MTPPYTLIVAHILSNKGKCMHIQPKEVTAYVYICTQKQTPRTIEYTLENKHTHTKNIFSLEAVSHLEAAASGSVAGSL